MKNVTISLPDDVYRRARIKAAERSTSVTTLVREILIAQDESDFDRRKRLQDEVIGAIRNFRAGDRFSREKVHSRKAAR